MGDRSDRMTLSDAAKAVGKRPAFVRDLIDRNKCRAWEDGGKIRKRLLVNLDELKAAIDRETIYVPPRLKPGEKPPRRGRRPTPSSSSIDPLVRC